MTSRDQTMHQTHQTHRRTRSAFKVILSFLTASMLLVVATCLALYRPLAQFIDPVQASADQSTYSVGQNQQLLYCPAQMALTDGESYGDSEFQVSAGDIQSSARFASVGAVYSAFVSSVNDPEIPEATLGSGISITSSGVSSMMGVVSDAARLLSARLVQSFERAGVVGSTVSWATTGDLKGVAAASCISSELNHHFIVGSTATGHTQELVLHNPSSQATSVMIRASQVGSSEHLVLNIDSTVIVPAFATVSVNLSAAAPNYDALYVEVTSEQLPVAALVRSIAMDGLSTLGSDYVLPSQLVSGQAIMPGLEDGDHVHLFVYPTDSGDMTVSTSNVVGQRQIAHYALTAGQLFILDMGQVDADIQALIADLPGCAYVQAQVTRSSNGYQDFAYIGAVQSYSNSAYALSSQTGSRIYVTNASSAVAYATLYAYDSEGMEMRTVDIRLAQGQTRLVDIGFVSDDSASHVNAESATSADSATMTISNQTAVLVLSSDADIHWGARVSQQQVADNNLVYAAYVGPTSLDYHEEDVVVVQDQTLVH